MLDYEEITEENASFVSCPFINRWPSAARLQIWRTKLHEIEIEQI
jgi:hypothetical protein